MDKVVDELAALTADVPFAAAAAAAPPAGSSGGLLDEVSSLSVDHALSEVLAANIPSPSLWPPACAPLVDPPGSEGAFIDDWFESTSVADFGLLAPPGDSEEKRVDVPPSVTSSAVGASDVTGSDERSAMSVQADSEIVAAGSSCESDVVDNAPLGINPVAGADFADVTVAGAPIASADTANTPVASTPVASTPVASTPVASTPVASTPVASTPVASTPVASTPVASTPVASTPVASTPVASTPVASTPVASTPVASTPVASTPVASTPVASTPLVTAVVAGALVADAGVSGGPAAIDSSPTAIVSSSIVISSAVTNSAVTNTAGGDSVATSSQPLNSAPITSTAISSITSMPITGAPSPITSTTDTPITSAPIIGASVTNAPLIRAPVTSTSVTSVPVTSNPITTTHVTNVSVTSDPVAGSTVTSTLVASSPIAHPAISSAAVMSTPITSTPIASTPIASPSIANASIANTTIASTPTTSTPVTSVPLTSTNITGTSLTGTNITTAPDTSTPTTSAPVTSAPVTSAPVTSAPLTSTNITSTSLTSTNITTAPDTSTPTTSTPVTSAPVTSTPVTSAPLTSTNITSTSLTSTNITTAPDTSTPTTSTPVTSAPLTSTNITSTSLTSTNIATAPDTSTPTTSAPLASTPAISVTSASPTSAPVTSTAITSTPIITAPVTSAPITSAPPLTTPFTSALLVTAPQTVDAQPVIGTAAAQASHPLCTSRSVEQTVLLPRRQDTESIVAAENTTAASPVTYTDISRCASSIPPQEVNTLSSEQTAFNRTINLTIKNGSLLTKSQEMAGAPLQNPLQPSSAGVQNRLSGGRITAHSVTYPAAPSAVPFSAPYAAPSAIPSAAPWGVPSTTLWMTSSATHPAAAPPSATLCMTSSPKASLAPSPAKAHRAMPALIPLASLSAEPSTYPSSIMPMAAHSFKPTFAPVVMPAVPATILPTRMSGTFRSGVPSPVAFVTTPITGPMTIPLPNARPPAPGFSPSSGIAPRLALVVRPEVATSMWGAAGQSRFAAPIDKTHSVSRAAASPSFLARRRPPPIVAAACPSAGHTQLQSGVTAGQSTGRPALATRMEAEFDPVNVMDWKDGVGMLPGSNLKFKVNEFGVIEMVTEDEKPQLECDEKLDGPAVFSDTMARLTATSDRRAAGRPPSAPDADDGLVCGEPPSAWACEEPTQLGFSLSDTAICRCENCGTHGLASEFCAGGRFCSKSCVGSFASKCCVSDVKKKKKRRLSIEDRSAKMARMCDDAPPPSSSWHNNGEESAEDLRKPAAPPPMSAGGGGGGGKKSRTFSWAQYLEKETAAVAPTKLFKQPFPVSKNGFRVSMKLEGIDSRHRSLYCVLSVAEVKGYRLRLHFDGYSECYDFWVNADSHFIFPAGWAEKNGKLLQPPKGYSSDDFSWVGYLKVTMSNAAPKHLFTNTQATSVTPHGFRVGLKLEAIDKVNAALTCVTTVSDVLGDNVLIHFDGWEDSYDYWCDPSSPYIHPVGWCQLSGKPLSPPNDWSDIEGFTWEEYLTKTKTQSVPARAFKTRAAHGFELAMKLEVVDQRNMLLVRVATVVDRTSHTLKLHFDGWSSIYDFWLDDDSPDIHPAGWCGKTGHQLSPPVSLHKPSSSSNTAGCPTTGCSGIGHIKGAKYTGHHSAFGCPYSQLNLNKENTFQDRLGPTRAEPCDAPSKMARGSVNIDWLQTTTHRKCPTNGCEGSGHTSGKYAVHYKASSCPLVERSVSCPSHAPPFDAPNKPLFGPGSGRGRKKSKLLKLIQKQKAAQSQLDGDVKEEPPSPSGDEADDGGESALHAGIHQSVFMSSMLASPSPSRDLPLCWEQHSKLLPGVAAHSGGDVARWSMADVATFVASLPGCRPLAPLFDEQQIDGEAFLLLNQTDIVKILNIKLGPALKIFNSILTFKNTV